MKKEKFQTLKQIEYVCLPLLVYILLYDICTAVVRYLAYLVVDAFGERGNAWLLDNLGTFKALCIMGGLILSFLCLLKLAWMDGFLKTKKETWKKPIWQYFLMIIGSVLLAYGFHYLFFVTGFMESSESFQNVAQSQYDVSLVVGLVLYGAISPFVEEVIFRGFLFGRMKVYMNWVVALFLSSLLFGIYHGNLVQGVYGFFMGLVFGLVAHKYQNFYLAVGMHAIANLVAFFVQIHGWL